MLTAAPAVAPYATTTARSPPDVTATCFAAPPRTRSLPYASSAPALSALVGDERDGGDAIEDRTEDCYARTVQRLKLRVPRSQPIAVPRARARARVTVATIASSPGAATPPLPDARPIVARFLCRERARRRGESPMLDPFVEWGAATTRVVNPFLSDAGDEMVPGRPPTDDGYLRRRVCFDEDHFY
ncbi:unnamed protein product [Agarophyton chilense]